VNVSDRTRSYKMQGCNSAGCSGWSASSNAVTIPPIPSTPGTPSASASGTTINLTWGASSSATYYKLQYNDGSGTWRTSSGTYYGTSYSWVNVSDRTRSYKMQGCNSAGCSGWSASSNVVNIPPIPSTPGTPSASTSGTTINLTWGASANATSYKLQYNAGSGTWQTSYSTYYGTSHSWPNVSDRTRSYKMQGCNSAGCSGWSASSNVVTVVNNQPPVITSAPDKVNLEWQGGRTLSVVANDPDGSDAALTYLWEQTEGVAVINWTGKTSATTTFQSPNIPDVPAVDGILRFNVTVTDVGGSSVSKIITMTLQQRPTASIIAPTINDIRMKSDDDLIIQLNNMKAVTGSISDAETIIYLASDNTYPVSWRSMNLNATKTEATYNYDSLSALPLLPNKRYRVIGRANANTSPKAYGWWNSRYFYVNDKPQITGGVGITGISGTPTTVLPSQLQITDEDDTQFTVTVVDGDNYTVSGATFTPDADVSGTLNVKVKVSDGIEDSNTYTIAVPVLSMPGTPSVNTEGTTIHLTWDASTNATHYKLQYNDGSGTWQTSSATYYGTSHSWIDVVDKTRSYKMQGCNTSGCTDWSAASNVVIIPPLPSIPSAPVATVSGTTINLTWDASEHATSYKLQYNDGSGAWQASSSTYYGTSQSWPNNAPMTRSYKLRGCNAAGCSNWSLPSNEVTAVATPESLNVSVANFVASPVDIVRGTDVTFTWDAIDASYSDFAYYLSADTPNTTGHDIGKINGTSRTAELGYTGSYKYYLKVCLDNGQSCGPAVTIDIVSADTTTMQVQSISASSSSIVQNNDVTISWQPPLNTPAGITYLLSATTPSGESSLGSINGTESVRTPTQTGTYQYHVQVCDGFGDNCGSKQSVSTSVMAVPELIKMSWEKSSITVGEKNSFSWEVSHVQSCMGKINADDEWLTYSAAGVVTGIAFYEAGNKIHQIYCTDQAGNRFPVDANTYLESSIEVKHLSAPQNLKEQPSE
ncbi:hypothetical protein, partial [Paraglaciecola sp.]|uniref:hypothetical protein n=1 Tax=Paraglaciecola sp. TaxID=1920173 RepID=UPI003EF89A4F